MLGSKSTGERFVAFITRRSVKLAVLAVVCLIGGSAVWYQRYVAPTLTARRYEVSIAGSDQHAVVGLDEAQSLVSVSGGLGALHEFAVTDSALFIRASDVLGEGTGWILVPLQALDARFAVLSPSRMRAAMARGPKECAPFGPDAAVLLTLLFGQNVASNTAGNLCDAGVFRGAEVGVDVLVRMSRIHPADVAGSPVDAVPLADVDKETVVVDNLNRDVRGV
jgi:hypothetical protein